MNFNILKPRHAVESAFKKPNAALGLGLVLASVVVTIAAWFMHFPGGDIVAFAIPNLVATFIYFFAAAILIYLFGFILKGKEAVSGKMSGILSALGLLAILSIAGTVIWALLLPFALGPETMELARAMNAGQLSPQEFAGFFELLLNNGVEMVNMGMLTALGVASFALGLWAAVLFYFTVSKIFNYRLLGNIVMLVVFALIMGILPL